MYEVRAGHEPKYWSNNCWYRTWQRYLQTAREAYRIVALCPMESGVASILAYCAKHARLMTLTFSTDGSVDGDDSIVMSSISMLRRNANLTAVTTMVLLMTMTCKGKSGHRKGAAHGRRSGPLGAGLDQAVGAIPERDIIFFSLPSPRALWARTRSGSGTDMRTRSAVARRQRSPSDSPDLRLTGGARLGALLISSDQPQAPAPLANGTDK